MRDTKSVENFRKFDEKLMKIARMDDVCDDGEVDIGIES